MKTKKTLIVLLILAGTFTACKKDSVEPEAAIPSISNVEIGLNNNEVGTIGKDFHFNADILAGDKIENVQIKIVPQSGEVYAKAWQFELNWDTYKGVKNTNVHKHFSIPADAAEGKYDFLITVFDQNGTKLELRKSITIYLEANLPVNPALSLFNIFNNDARFYRNGKFTVEGSKLKKGDIIHSQVTLSGIKGNGKMYLLLINKKLNYRPESIDKIDFNKVIVYDVVEHSNWPAVDFFSNTTIDPVTFQVTRDFPALVIGAEKDNNLPVANQISGAKAWESGTYYFAIIYQNTTYKMGYYQYTEIPVEL